MRFTVLHNRHHKESQSVPFFMHCKTVTILLRIRVRGHFVMSITKNHESYYVIVLDNQRPIKRYCICVCGKLQVVWNNSSRLTCVLFCEVDTISKFEWHVQSEPYLQQFFTIPSQVWALVWLSVLLLDFVKNATSIPGMQNRGWLAASCATKKTYLAQAHNLRTAESCFRPCAECIIII